MTIRGDKQMATIRDIRTGQRLCSRCNWQIRPRAVYCANCGQMLAGYRPSNVPTSLHDAVATDDRARVLGLLRSGVDINSINEQNLTPLDVAYLSNNNDMMLLLIEHGAKTRARIVGPAGGHGRQ